MSSPSLALASATAPVLSLGDARQGAMGGTATRVFDASFPASTRRTRLVIECDGPPELLERIVLRLVMLRD